MHKEELIKLHEVMAEIKDQIEKMDKDNNFSEYYRLNVTPEHVHKSKMEHKHAIFILGEEIASSMKDIEYSATNRTSARMHELAERTKKEIENSSGSN